MMNVSGLTISLLSMTALEDEKYEVEFQDGAILIRSVRVGTQDAAVMLSIKEGSLHKLLGHHVVGFRGSLELSFRGSLEFGQIESSRCEDLPSSIKTRRWHEMAIQDAQE